MLRLASDSLTLDLGLTLLAFVNVEIRSLALFDAAAGNGNVPPKAKGIVTLVSDKVKLHIDPIIKLSISENRGKSYEKIK